MTKIVIDPEFAALIPAATPEEYSGLEASLKREGCRDALIVWREKSILLDGHSRYRICHEQHIRFAAKALSFPDRDAAMAWSIDNQLGRRNLPVGARTMLAARRATLGHGERPTEQNSAISIKKAAENAGVSTASIKDAKTVISDGTPALQQAVTDGVVPVSTAAQAAALPPAEQDAAVAGGQAGVRAAIKRRIVTLAEYEGTAPTKDQAGRDIPSDKPKIAEVFKRRAEITAFMTALSRIKTEVLRLAEAKDPLWAKLSASDFAVHMENAHRSLRFAAPSAVCPSCSADGCRACKNTGWVQESVYASAPPEMK